VNGRDPIELRDALAAVTRDLRMPAPETLDVVTSVLADVLGPALTTHARVRSVRDGTCVIEADAPAIASRVRYLVDTFTTRVNEASGRPIVRAVNVVVKAP
jgi:hypothetical protein